MINMPRITYAFAALMGLVAATVTMPMDAIMGHGPAWDSPGMDTAQALAGHLAFQVEKWQWPLLSAAGLFWPHGVSVVLTDSNPAVSLAAKLFVSLNGGTPVNWLGYWLAICWIMQPVAAVFAARGLRLPPFACLAAAGLSVSWPALVFRYVHPNLCGHFILLLALGLALRSPDRRGWWLAAAGLLVGAVFIHPYFFELSGIVLASVPLQAALDRRPEWRRIAVRLLLLGVGTVGLLWLLSGSMEGGAKGFVLASMNLLSPIWPQRSGVVRLMFGVDMPLLNATGFQYEGFNWVGAGVVLLAPPAIAGWLRIPPAWRHARGLLCVLAALTLLSLSSHVYAGNVRILNLGAKPWEDIFGTFRAAGRAFWPVGYALMLGAVAGVARWQWRLAPLLFLAAVLLQWVDADPLRAEQRAAWTHGAAVASVPMPAGMNLFGVAPYPGCQPDPAVRVGETQMLLDAVRAGARLRDIGVGRTPKWFSCERLLADRLEEPLLAGEVRVFLGGARAMLVTTRMGPAAECREQRDMVFCARGLGGLEGKLLPVARAAAIGLPMAAAGPDLAPALGVGWKLGQDGAWWTVGSMGTVSLNLPPEAATRPLKLTLHVAAVGAREVRLEAGDIVRTIDLGNGAEANIALTVPPAEGSGLRLVLSGGRAADPARLGLEAPVNRSAIRLLGLNVQAE